MRSPAALVPVGALVALLLAAGVFPVEAQAASSREIAAASVVKLLRLRAVILPGYRIKGDLDLSGRVVKHRLICPDCRFQGGLLAARATFKQTVDLTGSDIAGKFDLSGAGLEGGLLASGATFQGVVDLRGSQFGGTVALSESRFKAPLVLGTPLTAADDPTTFSGDADFSLASFSDLATFEGVIFEGKSDFTLARFDDQAVFADGEVDKSATFARTMFRNSADFNNFQFSATTTFEGAQFSGPAHFNSANFEGRVSFERAQFAEGATFLVATFPKQPNLVDSFASVQSGGDLDFSFVALDRGADFEDLQTKGKLSFKGASLTKANGLHFPNLSAGALEMSVQSALTAVSRGDVLRVLELIESSAKARNDLSAANDAHYARHVLESRQESLPVRSLNVIFYRAVAGYFVRPLNPLTTLLALAALITIARTAWLESRSPRPARSNTGRWDRSRLAGRRAAQATGRFSRAYLDTLASVSPLRGTSTPERQPGRIEILTYRLLFVCVLIAFANANPTLRQMFDAIH